MSSFGWLCSKEKCATVTLEHRKWPPMKCAKCGQKFGLWRRVSVLKWDG